MEEGESDGLIFLNKCDKNKRKNKIGHRTVPCPTLSGYVKEDYPEGVIQETEIIGLDLLMEYSSKCKEINKDTVK